MFPAFGAIYLMLWNLSQNPVFATHDVYWVITAVLTGIYIVSTFDTINQQRATRRALERAQQEANLRAVELERLSRNDSLTGLMNRRAFDEIVQSMMNQHANKQGVTVFSIDLDGFKPINDSYATRPVMLCFAQWRSAYSKWQIRVIGSRVWAAMNFLY